MLCFAIFMWEMQGRSCGILQGKPELFLLGNQLSAFGFGLLCRIDKNILNFKVSLILP